MANDMVKVPIFLFSSSIFGQIGEELGLVGCIESLKIESKDTSKEYDLMYPGSRDIIGGSGIGKKFKKEKIFLRNLKRKKK